MVVEKSLFIDMARIFPRFSFAMGADVLHELLDPRHYRIRVVKALREFDQLGTKFIVANRAVGREDINIPNGFSHLFMFLDNPLWNMSSTLVRKLLISPMT